MNVNKLNRLKDVGGIADGFNELGVTFYCVVVKNCCMDNGQSGR